MMGTLGSHPDCGAEGGTPSPARDPIGGDPLAESANESGTEGLLIGTRDLLTMIS